MDENPYQPPTEVSPRPTTPSQLKIGLMIGGTVWAAWIFGGITCYSVGVSGELRAKALGYEQNENLRELGWTLGIPVALVVMVLISIFSYWLFMKRRP